MPIDHVLVALADPPATAARLLDPHGLSAIEGGRHPAWGTGNCIVPLGSCYLELVFVAEPGAASRSPFGRRSGEAIAAGGGPYAWCVAPTDFESMVARLGLTVSDGSRRRPDGTVLAWRTAGLEVALADPSRPFFIDWRVAAPDHPGRAPRADESARLTRLELTGDARAIRSWLGDEDVPIVIRPGPPAITAIVVETAAGELILRGQAWS